jgi:hypothetical protein
LRLIEALRKRQREADGTTPSGGRASAAAESATSGRASLQAGSGPPSGDLPPGLGTGPDEPRPTDPDARAPEPARSDPPEIAGDDERGAIGLSEAEIRARVARISEVLDLSPATPAADVEDEAPGEVPGPSPARMEPLPPGDPDRGSARLTEVADGRIEVPPSIDPGSRNPTDESGRAAATTPSLAAAVLALFALLFLAGLPAVSARSSIEPAAAKPDRLAGRVLARSSSDTPIPARWLCSSPAPDAAVAGVPGRESVSGLCSPLARPSRNPRQPRPDFTRSAG